MTGRSGWLWKRGWWLRVVGLVICGVMSIGAAPGRRPLADLRVRSEASETIVEAWIGAGVPVTDRTGDRTVVAKPTTGLIGGGSTFAEEIRLLLPETEATRATSVIVGDPLVSEVRVLPRDAGSELVVFVRQPAHYEAQRIGEELLLRIRPLAPGEPRPTRREVITGRGDEREIAVDAEVLGYERQGSVIHARGGVAVTRPGMTLTAEEVRINRETSEGQARGDVVLRTDGVTARGDYAQLNLTDERGFFESGEVDLPKTGYVITGDRLQKGFGQTYRVRDGTFTTCRCGGLEAPAWSFASPDLDVDLHGTGRARNVTFRVRDYPVLYFPYALFPVNRTRQTGFLMPRVGQSFGSDNPRGFEYEQPFFWAINKSTDATMAFRVETEARVGGVGEYRYALNRYSRGTIAGTYFNESLRTKAPEFDDPKIVATPPENRWGVYTKMRDRSLAGVQAYLDTMVVSDDLFFREIQSATFKPLERQSSQTRFYTASRVGGLRASDHLSVWSEGTFYQDLNVQLKNEDETVFQRAPMVEVLARRAVLNDRLALAFAGQSVNYQREEGFDGLRVDLQPQARVPFRFGRFVFGQLEGSLRGTGYHQTDGQGIERVCVGGPTPGAPCNSETACGTGGSCEVRPVELVCVGGPRAGRSCTDDASCGTGGTPPPVCRARSPGQHIDENQVRGTLRLGWRLGTEIARVYPFERWGFSKLKHTIEPVVSYGWIPHVGGQGDLPLYDGVDRINRRSLLSYGFESRLKARYAGGAADGDASQGTQPAPPIREIARLSVLQAYDTERKIAGDEQFSDVDIGLRLTPNNLLALESGATYNLAETDVKGGNVTLLSSESWRADNAQLARLQNPSSLALSYQFVAKDVGAVASEGAKALSGLIYLRLGRYLGLLAHTRYDLLTKLAFERGLGARFISRCNCWMIEVGVENRQTPEKDTSVRLQLTLSGIGSFGQGASGSGRNVLTSGLKRGDSWP